MGWARRIRNLWWRERLEDEIAEELRSHIELAVEEATHSGISQAEARRAAHLRFGNLSAMRERTAGSDAALGFTGLGRDLGYAIRQLHKSPGFALTVVLTLAAAVGINLAVFQLLYEAVLAPLPVAKPAELVSLHAVASPFDGQWFFSYPAYQRLRKATAGSALVIARSGIDQGVLQSQSGAAGRARYQLVSDNFFSVLGVPPADGRWFAASDAQPGRSEWPVVLRYGFAREHFGAAAAVGQHAILNGVPIIVVGVAAKSFGGVLTGYAPDLWLPLEAQATGHLDAWFDSLGPGYGIHLSQPWQNQPGIFWLWTLARVSAENRPAAAAQWSAAIRPDLALMADAVTDPRARAAILRAPVRLLPAGSGEGPFRQRSRLPLLLLMAMAAAIFLAGCMNLANLQAARLSTRQRELGVRMSLGAGRWRLLRQLLVEHALLALLGGLLAILAGRVASVVLLHWASTRGWPLDIDLRAVPPTLALGAALLFISLVLFTLLPAWQLLRGNFSEASGSKWLHATAFQSRAARRRSAAAMAFQISLSLLLAGMAATFAETMIHLSRMNTGMDRAHVLSVHVDMTDTGYVIRQKDLPALYRTLVGRIQALPQVRAAGVAMCSIPGCGWNTKIYVFGNPQPAAAQAHGEENHVGPGYFRALGIPLLRGRDFSATDRPETLPVAIVNAAYARKLFGGENPIGHWIGYEPAPNDHQFLIVGEAANARVDGLLAATPPVVYFSIDQRPAPIHSIEVLSAGAPDAVAGEIRNALHELDAALPVTSIVRLNVELQDNLTTENLLERLTGMLAALTIVLAAVGFYGLLSFRVAQRRSEIGVRMAVGATRAQVQGLVLGQTAIILVAGILPGIVLTALMMHIARSLLYGSAYGNWLACAAAVLVLGCTGIAAAWIPARRASRVDPVEALRAE